MRLICLTTFILIIAAPLQAQISSRVIDWQNSGGSIGYRDFDITFCQSFPGSESEVFTIDDCDHSFLSIRFNENPFDLEVTSFALDQLADFYFVKEGDEFSKEAIQNGEFENSWVTLRDHVGDSISLIPYYQDELNYLPRPVDELLNLGVPESSIQEIYRSNYIAENYSNSNGQSIFLGISTSTSFAIDTQEDRDHFGWIELRLSGIPNGRTLEMVDHAIAFDSAGIIVGTRTSLPVPEPSTAMMLGCISFAYLSRRHSH